MSKIKELDRTCEPGDMVKFGFEGEEVGKLIRWDDEDAVLEIIYEYRIVVD